jgi:hypothetical protein
MDDYRIDFAGIPWESPIPGMRQKVRREGARRVRLVEYAREMEPHWCERGHWGCVIEGTFEIEFDDGLRVFEPGDGVLIPDGPAHRHKGRVLSDTVRCLFVEDV